MVRRKVPKSEPDPLISAFYLKALTEEAEALSLAEATLKDAERALGDQQQWVDRLKTAVEVLSIESNEEEGNDDTSN